MNVNISTNEIINSTNINVNSIISNEISTTEYSQEISSFITVPTTYIQTPFFTLYIVQVSIRNELLKIYAFIPKIIEKISNITIPIRLYKNNNNKIRYLQERCLINLYTYDSIDSSKIIEFTSEEKFNDSDRIVVILESNPNFEMKVLNNNKNFLDSKENEIMIKNGEMVDLSLRQSVNSYYIESASIGCNFKLISEKDIEVQRHNIDLIFSKKGDKNNKLTVKCTISSEYKNKIPCKLEQEINDDYTLESYMGSNGNNFYFIESNEPSFHLQCQKSNDDDNHDSDKKNNDDSKDNNKKTNDNKNKGIYVIIIIVSAFFVSMVIFVVYMVCCRKKKIPDSSINKIDSNIADSRENINENV
jgi:hypothetical protein